MPFTPDDHLADGQHAWALIVRTCNLDDPDDQMVTAAITLFREAYGEVAILALAADPDVAATFDLRAIRSAIRTGFPDPAVEANKPIRLTNYRSEPTEILSRGALARAHGIDFPASPQLGKSNANMPILGFDGWGIINSPNDCRLVLVQVKGTDDEASPPREAHRLLHECKAVTREPAKLARALSILVLFLRDTHYVGPLLSMLEVLGRGELPNIAIAPVIVRGITPASMRDLEPIRAEVSNLASNRFFGVTISLGVDLADFGRLVIERARAA